jgi:hypothetical protein
VQKVREQALEYIELIEQHGPAVMEQILDEVHTSSSKTRQGPIQGLAAVVALGVSLATCGWGAGVATSLEITSALGTGMISAGVTTLSTQFIMGMLNQEGNLGRVLKGMGSK